MSHEIQDCPKNTVVLNPTERLSSNRGRANVFDRVRASSNRSELRDRDSKESSNNLRGKDETSYNSYKDDSTSISRVQRSSYSSRNARGVNPKSTRYNPYNSNRGHQSSSKMTDKSHVWKDKPLQISNPEVRLESTALSRS